MGLIFCVYCGLKASGWRGSRVRLSGRQGLSDVSLTAPAFDMMVQLAELMNKQCQEDHDIDSAMHGLPAAHVAQLSQAPNGLDPEADPEQRVIGPTKPAGKPEIE